MLSPQSLEKPIDFFMEYVTFKEDDDENIVVTESSIETEISDTGSIRPVSPAYSMWSSRSVKQFTRDIQGRKSSIIKIPVFFL